MINDAGLTVGQVAERSGLAVSAIHFYETRGLIQSWRNGANHRRYAQAVLRRLAVIKVAQRTGIPLKDIAEAMDRLPGERPVSAADWRKLSTWWKDDLDDRIERLQRLRDGLDDCIGCGCLSLKKCRLMNPDDQLADTGAGARILDPGGD